MPSSKMIGGTPITDADPLQVAIGGATSQPTNGKVAVTNASTQLIGAAAATITDRRTLVYCPTAAIHVAEGEAATTSKFLVPAGSVFKSSSLLAINAILDTGSSAVDVYVLAEAR